MGIQNYERGIYGITAQRGKKERGESLNTIIRNHLASGSPSLDTTDPIQIEGKWGEKVNGV